MTDSVTIDVEERDRVLAIAESNPAFRAIAQALSDLVDKAGMPESEIEASLAPANADLITMFRLLRTVAAVTKRLRGVKAQQQGPSREELLRRWNEIAQYQSPSHSQMLQIEDERRIRELEEMRRYMESHSSSSGLMPKQGRW